MTLFHRLIAAPFWPLCAAYRFVSWRRRVRRAREVKAEAVREQERSMAHRRAALQKQWVAAVKLNRMVQMKARDASWN